MQHVVGIPLSACGDLRPAAGAGSQSSVRAGSESSAALVCVWQMERDLQPSVLPPLASPVPTRPSALGLEGPEAPGLPLLCSPVSASARPAPQLWTVPLVAGANPPVCQTCFPGLSVPSFGKLPWSAGLPRVPCNLSSRQTPAVTVLASLASGREPRLGLSCRLGRPLASPGPCSGASLACFSVLSRRVSEAVQ